jgi:hypothetical protein
MIDDRRHTAWGFDDPASPDGARLLIKTIRDLVDNQNRLQPAGMKDERREALAAASQSISDAFETLAVGFIEPHAATNKAMAKFGYGLLYKLIVSSFGAGSGSLTAGHERLKLLKEMRHRLKQKENGWLSGKNRRENRPWVPHAEELAQQIRKENASASQSTIADEILSGWKLEEIQPPSHETLKDHISKTMIAGGGLAPRAKRTPSSKKKGKKGASLVRHPG